MNMLDMKILSVNDESIISYFNIIFEFILFRFNIFLFPF